MKNCSSGAFISCGFLWPSRRMACGRMAGYHPGDVKGKFREGSPGEAPKRGGAVLLRETETPEPALAVTWLSGWSNPLQSGDLTSSACSTPQQPHRFYNNFLSTGMDYYSIVGVSASADSNQITSAYRKASLKVHPDRNPDDPLASEKFQALKTAFEILLDPIKRAEFDAKRATQAARTARFAGLDNKRKALARDLEAREEAYQKQQTDSLQKAAKIRKLEEIKAAGAKLRQAKMSELAAATIPTPSTQPAKPSPVQSTSPPAAPVETCDTLECTLRFKWTRKKLPDLNTVEDLSTRICSCDLIKTSDIESVVISTKNSSESGVSSKKGSAVVCFKTVALCNRFFDFAQADPDWTNCAVTRLCSSS
ncbi:hypothetical protein PGT21_034594 [Puccinia graminis f. sp. tritici]|uniref:J domain-containing protein n=1 Tax=Puccinia graminis f. sp. tritici TaxID=56615 RepID=A0A5B0QQW0_PUCGR|nr:hypothetical protein PGT21_034594 [Puccinia graminis f. sp. tritici]